MSEQQKVTDSLAKESADNEEELRIAGVFSAYLVNHLDHLNRRIDAVEAELRTNSG